MAKRKAAAPKDDAGDGEVAFKRAFRQRLYRQEHQA